MNCQWKVHYLKSACSRNSLEIEKLYSSYKEYSFETSNGKRYTKQ